jgi:unsaturated chondroitin disaccharide hydrolase
LSTGQFLHQSTHQGWAPESAWARGLAWSMYGFSQVYGLTGNDLSQPLPWGPQKDTSAGAIAASALLDLELQTKNEDLAVIYRTTAEAMLDALVEPRYLAVVTPGWEGILKHGVYHTKKNLGVDESVMWGDYFLVEALTKALGRKSLATTPTPPANIPG